MVDIVGKYTVRACAIGKRNGSTWSGHWTIVGPGADGNNDSIFDGDVEGPFVLDVEAIHSARLAGIARAKELEEQGRLE